MQFVHLKKEELDLYDSFVQESVNSMLYHSLNYLNFAAKLLECKIEIHGLQVNHSLIAACPWLVKDGVGGKVYNSLAYYGANGGILATQDEHLAFFCDEMHSYICARASAYSSISNPFQEILFPNIDYTQNRIAQVTKLPFSHDESALMDLFHAKTRNMIRKGLKEDVQVNRVNDSSFLEHTHKQNMVAVSVAPKESNFFQNLDEYFESGLDYQIYEALVDGVKAAAVLLFYHKKTVEYYMPAINIDFRNRQIMSALIFKVMQDSINQGYSIWNWGGTPLANENLHRFKSRFGAFDLPYTIQTKVIDSKLLTLTREQIMNAYPGMFVVPFELLKA